MSGSDEPIRTSPVHRTGLKVNAIDAIATGFPPIRRRPAVRTGPAQLFDDPMRSRTFALALSVAYAAHGTGEWDARHLALGRTASTAYSIFRCGLEKLQSVLNL